MKQELRNKVTNGVVWHKKNTAARHKNWTWHEILWRDLKLNYHTAVLQQERTMNAY